MKENAVPISKQDYILKSLRKIAHKKWELFVVSRILHGLDDDEIEIVTQQLVRISDGKPKLTDLFFPQFSLHLEIDESPHEKKIDADTLRERDIIEATGHRVEHVKIAGENGKDKEMSAIREEVDEFVALLRKLKNEASSKRVFIPWDFEMRYTADPVIARGHVSIADNVVFEKQIEALRCFGFTKKSLRKGAWVIPDGSQDVIWFPRLFVYDKWHNELVDEGRRIYERAVNKDGRDSIAKQKADGKKWPERKFIVFAKARDALGFNLLRYVGSFKMNLEASTPDALRFDRVATSEAVRK